LKKKKERKKKDLLEILDELYAPGRRSTMEKRKGGKEKRSAIRLGRTHLGWTVSGREKKTKKRRRQPNPKALKPKKPRRGKEEKREGKKFFLYCGDIIQNQGKN